MPMPTPREHNSGAHWMEEHGVLSAKLVHSSAISTAQNPAPTQANAAWVKNARRCGVAAEDV